MKYNLRVSKRARYMRLEVRRNGELVVTVPRGLDLSFVERFIIQKSGWIQKTQSYFEKSRESGKDVVLRLGSVRGRKNYLEYKEQARLLAENRISFFNKIYNFRINKISIKNTKSRWGSCSKKGNINFNYKIALLPMYLADYIIVHELCHLKEFNHSQNFWKLVSLALPDYRNLRKKFRK